MDAEPTPTPPNADQLAEQRWQAVVRRDANSDGEFVYAVRTTGVYCRPSCPSRAAKRENVAFFDTAAWRALRQAGDSGASSGLRRGPKRPTL
jgi:AraC family transcriptional regulator of adaptative response/methylated-DNA-[protein]-cysteine methyltransferase